MLIGAFIGLAYSKREEREVIKIFQKNTFTLSDRFIQPFRMHQNGEINVQLDSKIINETDKGIPLFKGYLTDLYANIDMDYSYGPRYLEFSRLGAINMSLDLKIGEYNLIFESSGESEILVEFSVSLIYLDDPFSKYVDSHSFQERIRWLIIGSFFIVLVPFIYIFAKHIYTIFFAQIVFGIGSGLAYPTWLGLWSTHLDKRKESFEWSLYSTLIGLGTALTAAIGAASAQFIGFNFTFAIVGAISFIGFLMLFELDRRRDKLEIILGKDYHKKRKLVRKGRV